MAQIVRSLVGVPTILLAVVGCGQHARFDDPEDTQEELTAGTYTFGTLTTTGKCLDVTGAGTASGTAIQQWGCNGGAGQQFRVQNGNGTSKLINPNSNKCFDVNGASTANGAKIQIWTCNNSAAQVFRVENAGGGNVRIVNPNSGKCVDVTGAAATDGTKIELWTCNNSKAQLFRPNMVGSTTTTGGSTTTTGGSTTTTGGGGTFRKANLTNFTSYPDPGSEECIKFNGCMWAGQFAFVDGKQSEAWVRDHNILAVHSKDASKYKLKTLRLKQGSHQIDAVVYDECADSDCSGCCTENSRETGFLIDIEKFTMQRFGSGDGIVDWTCLDCP